MIESTPCGTFRSSGTNDVRAHAKDLALREQFSREVAGNLAARASQNLRFAKIFYARPGSNLTSCAGGGVRFALKCGNASHFRPPCFDPRAVRVRDRPVVPRYRTDRAPERSFPHVRTPASRGAGPRGVFDRAIRKCRIHVFCRRTGGGVRGSTVVRFSRRPRRRRSRRRSRFGVVERRGSGRSARPSPDRQDLQQLVASVRRARRHRDRRIPGPFRGVPQPLSGRFDRGQPRPHRRIPRLRAPRGRRFGRVVARHPQPAAMRDRFPRVDRASIFECAAALDSDPVTRRVGFN